MSSKKSVQISNRISQKLTESNYCTAFTKVYEIALLAYLSLCLLFFSARTVTPLMDYINTTPFRNLMTWLMNTGLIFIAAGFFTSVRNKRNPKVVFLYLICLIATVSSFMQRHYGYKTNVNNVCWMLIVYILFFNAPVKIRRNSLRRTLHAVYFLSAGLWSTACLLSLVQFALLIGINGPNYSSSPFLGGRGFYLSRLFGLFNTPEYGAVSALMFLIWGFYYLMSAKNHLSRIVVFILCLPLFVYLVVCYSRNAAVALLVSTFFGSWLLFRKYFNNTRSMETDVSEKWKLPSRPLPFACALVATAAVLVLYLLTQAVAAKLPLRFAKKTEASISVDLSSPERPTLSGVAGVSLHIRGQEQNIVLKKQVIDNPSNSVHRHPHGLESVTLENNTNLLSRPEIAEDISRGRFQIWSDYLSLYRHIGLIGLSPGCSARYIQEHVPDLYICTSIRDRFPENYKRGYVYHPHNGYLKLFASTGFLGVLCLLLFIGFNAVPVVNYIRRHPAPAPEFVFSFLVVLAGGSAAMFDTELFFVMVPTTLIFWTGLGILLNIVSSDTDAEKEEN